MSASRCAACAELAAVWDDALGSAVCTSCGTLSDPLQHALAVHPDPQAQCSSWIPNPTLKSLRSTGWALSGQGKELRQRQNTFAINAFVDTLCRRLSNSVVSARARTIFHQAMTRGKYRWGRKAKLIAGAAVAVALRESHKSESLRDISILLDDSPTALSRTFNAVVNLLQLNLTCSDPAVHLSTLQTHLLHIINLPTSDTSSIVSLPKDLLAVIGSLQPHFSHVMKTSQALSVLVTRIGVFTHLPTPSTACAIFILALEGEHRMPLPNCGALAQALGSRFGVGKGVIMQRYRAIYEIIEEWIKEVPWLTLDRGMTKPSGRKSCSAQTGRRAAVAKGLNDVIQFQDEIWRKKIVEINKVELDLELDGDESDESLMDDDLMAPKSAGTNVNAGLEKRTISPNSDSHLCKQRKKRKTRHGRTMETASHFLLDPHAPNPSDIGLLSHLLTSDMSTLQHAFVQRPTRLQMLSGTRPGGERLITDEELFEEGELEGLMRNEEERESYSKLINWDEIEGDQESRRNARKERTARKENKSQVADHGFASMGGGTKKINMEAFQRLINTESCLDALAKEDDGEQDRFFDFDHDGGNSDACGDSEDGLELSKMGQSCGKIADGADVDEMEDWRPLSPTGDFARFDQYES